MGTGEAVRAMGLSKSRVMAGLQCHKLLSWMVHEPVVYGAAFRAGGVFVAVDILKRDGRSFRLIEVKSTTSVKDRHIPDVAVQAHVLRQNGLDLASTEVMHLNRECTYPDLSNLFVRSRSEEHT